MYGIRIIDHARLYSTLAHLRESSICEILGFVHLRKYRFSEVSSYTGYLRGRNQFVSGKLLDIHLNYFYNKHKSTKYTFERSFNLLQNDP